MVDYALYLVTDSSKAILGDRDLIAVVEAAIEGGVTVVQYRDKVADTAALIHVGTKLHEITKKYGIPLLINDRVDVALAIGAEGVHIGQDDMGLAASRKLLGPDAIIGVTCSSVEEAHVAVKDGANYVGIGTMFQTPTKENTKTVIGTTGTKAILNALSALDQKVPAVAIGGINASNVQRVMYQSKAPFKCLNGVAVVSAIISAESPKNAASELHTLMAIPPPFAAHRTHKTVEVERLLDQVPGIVEKLGRLIPLCHNMTNLVVQNFAANVALAIGGSPIMSNYGEEAKDLAKMDGSLVINMGTATPELLRNYCQALQAYNAQGAPVLLDPVGAGATEIRRKAVKSLMASGYFSIIKGNENEIRTVWGECAVRQKGVDSVRSTSSDLDKARLVKKLAARERNVVLMTGRVDFLSDGDRIYMIDNGDDFLGRITGSGCTLGTTIAAFAAVHKEDMLLAVLAGTLMYEIAAETAAERLETRGPGSFIPNFLDELNMIATYAGMGRTTWIGPAKVSAMNV